MGNRFNTWLIRLESRWSLWNLLQGSALVGSFALPAWAAQAADIFSQYQPFSWVVAGLGGVFISTMIYTAFQYARKIRINVKYDEKHLDSDSLVNPLDRTFEGKRIFLNDFALPSHPYISGKTFIDCEIIGPANVYFLEGNQATEVKVPQLDAVYLEPGKTFYNGFQFENCIFRGCSFQRITLFISDTDYHVNRDNNWLNWVSLTPDTPPLLDPAHFVEVEVEDEEEEEGEAPLPNPFPGQDA
jgi:hypothetical protein